MSGHEHSVRRALVAPAFRGKELQQKFLPVIERNARQLIDGFREAGSVDLVADFARLFPINVIVDMLGLDQNDRDRFQRWYTSIIAFLGNLNRDPGIEAAGKRTREEFAEYPPVGKHLHSRRMRRMHPRAQLRASVSAAQYHPYVASSTTSGASPARAITARRYFGSLEIRTVSKCSPASVIRANTERRRCTSIPTICLPA